MSANMNDDRSGAPSGGRGIWSTVRNAWSDSSGQTMGTRTQQFFLKVADAVAASNRNMKIGLAFLTAAFVVTAVGLGWLALRQARKTDSIWEGVPSKIQEIVKPMEVRIDKMQVQVAAFDTKVDGVQRNAAAEGDASRAEIARLRSDLKGLQTDLVELRNWVHTAQPQLQEFMKKTDERVKRLERKTE